MLARNIVEAAEAVHALINSRPSSPTTAELIVLLAEHLAEPAVPGPGEWDALVRSFAPHDFSADAEALDDVVAETERVLASPVKSIGDLGLLAGGVCALERRGAVRSPTPAASRNACRRRH